MSKDPINRPTGQSDPGLPPVHDDTPYEGDRHPEGAHKPGHIPGGPGHDGCNHN